MNGEPFTGYFNYFTEIEEHFQRARGTSLFLLSPLDWALLESWKNAGIPLEAVLRGIDAAFEKWRARKSRTRLVNSLAYCSQAVMAEAQRMADSGGTTPPKVSRKDEAAPFPLDVLTGYIEAAAVAVRAAAMPELDSVALSLERIVQDLPALSMDLEALEQHLGVLEQRLVALIRSRQSEAQALEIRKQLDTQLRPWRTRMTGPQIALLETQFLDRATLESARLPRLSLFYLR